MSDISGQTYTPGQTYFIESQAQRGQCGGTPKYGFQMTSLNAADAMAGSFNITNAARNSTQTGDRQ